MPPSSPLLDLRFVVVSGKGGVGRTTVAAALARGAARAGKRVLLAQTAAAPRLGKLLGRPDPIGPKIVPIAPNLDAVNMTPREAQHEYALMVLKYEAVYRALFENRAARGFLSAVPGLDAYAMLGKAWWHTTEPAAGADAGSGARRYDMVILDGPASGHAITMLRIPQAIIDSSPSGPLARDARALRTLLSDPASTALVIVTLPEELPVRETLELAAAGRDVLAMPLGPVVVNAMPPDRLEHPAVAAVLDRVPAATGDDALDRTLRAAANVRAHRLAAKAQLDKLRASLPAPAPAIVQLPWFPVSELGPAEIDRLAQALLAGTG